MLYFNILSHRKARSTTSKGIVHSYVDNQSRQVKKVTLLCYKHHAIDVGRVGAVEQSSKYSQILA